MTLYAGIDCGTQSTKVVIVDSQKAIILGEGSAPHPIISDSSGRREQHAHWWTDALESAFAQAIQNAGIIGTEIVALAVSGQQHGFVPLNSQGEVLAPAKLWCDTETALENQQIIDALGGPQAALDQLGLMPQTGYTASKILWFKTHQPELWQQLSCVLLPHDYLNFWLTGKQIAEYGDASGTGLLNTRTRQWDDRVVNLIDPEGRLRKALPDLIAAETCIGTVLPEIAEKLGISATTKVATGGGDNMMAAIGTGNISPGIITMSLGTSGTLFTYSDTPVVADSEMIAGFCSSNNGWLPLICTMNVTSATTIIQNFLDLDIHAFNDALNQSEPGANGLMMLPFFNGERVPPLPHAKASLHNLDGCNLNPQNLSLAVVESATYGLRFGIDLFRQQGIETNEIRLTGGGARSEKWRQIVANIMATPVVCVTHKETAALGAAIQAIWCNTLTEQDDKSALLANLCQKFVHLDETTHVVPDADMVSRYEVLYQDYLSLLKAEYPKVPL
ncbi:xylulokinase [Pragia fontium]|uniref:Xylulose kinase n=1 Tax=Pragia fontium TaxID=82985 RepID=A0ABQ5LLD3_9GAMM|nr:xylulokinase [Pragia fontium]GKX64440.1 xylulokinase [Pragia fontium]